MLKKKFETKILIRKMYNNIPESSTIAVLSVSTAYYSLTTTTLKRRNHLTLILLLTFYNQSFFHIKRYNKKERRKYIFEAKQHKQK